MNEKGFATIFGLCLILAIVLFVKGIQESEGNHAYQTTDFQTEFDLQNAAESGIYMAAEKVRSELINDQNYLPFDREYPPTPESRKKCRVKVINKTINTSSGLIILDVWVERLLIIPYMVNYNQDGKNVAKLIADGKTKEERASYVFFSKAELESARAGGKLYRRAFAYVFYNDSDWTIHFMEVTAGDYTYKD